MTPVLLDEHLINMTVWRDISLMVPKGAVDSLFLGTVIEDAMCPWSSTLSVMSPTFFPRFPRYLSHLWAVVFMKGYLKMTAY